MTETSSHGTHDVDISRSQGPATALRATSALAVLAILWQGATAGGILIPETAKEKPQRGKVVAVGDGTDDTTMWAHVPGALLLMLGAAAVLVRALLPQRAVAR